jgi:hypothetical protein
MVHAHGFGIDTMVFLVQQLGEYLLPCRKEIHSNTGTKKAA